VSSYDTISVDGKVGQVKLWGCEMIEYEKGDAPPAIPVRDYSIAMREGGYVNITNDKIQSWTDKPEWGVVFDKWGQHFNEEVSKGLMDDDYFFPHKEENDGTTDQ
jgi:hypothetical protein